MKTLLEVDADPRGGRTQQLRLPALVLETIRRTIRDVFPVQTEIILFGSRTDPEARGGDLDLLVIAHAAREALARARIRAIALLQLALGDQHIDLVVTSDPEHDARLVVREALRTGVAL
jgi:predicted nucleotidyltransferase